MVTASGKSRSDYLIEVARGNINNTRSIVIVARNEDVGNTYEDIWDAGGILTLPTAAETWEIVSDDTNDTLLGTGLRTVIIQSLDANYEEQSQIVDMDGTTPVILDDTHLRPRIMIAVKAGFTEANIGNIILRASGGGATRGLMLPGNGISNSSHFTIPASHTGFALSINFWTPKDQDHNIRLVNKGSDPDDARFIVGEIDQYQQGTDLPVFAPIPMTEKRDFKFQAKSSNESSTISMIQEILLIKD